MTCREKLAMDHPKKIDPECSGGCCGCPAIYGYLDDPDYCVGGDDINCTKCWDREIPGTLPMQYKVDVEDAGEVGKPDPQWLKENPHIKDSGDRTEFPTGAVRDMREGKGRCDLMPLGVVATFMQNNPILHELRMFLDSRDTNCLYRCLETFSKYYEDNLTKPDMAAVYRQRRCTMFLEVAKHFEEGAKKYGENNWQKGIPVHCYIDSAVRHYLKWLRGDKDEPHDRAFVWNLMCCIWEVDYSTRIHNAKVEASE